LTKRRSLTLRSENGISRILTSPIQIYRANEKQFVEITGLWDTGATGSAITKDVVEKLKLIPTGMARVQTASGPRDMNTYTVDVMLPQANLIKSIVATEVDNFAGTCDALIGMDIITLGDFSITNHKGQTVMSFRIPSSHEIDYVKSPNYGVVEIVTLDSDTVTRA